MAANDLKNRLIQRIQASGPLSVADYMAACLGDPKAGYYMTRDPFGQTGDFITAPEVSQMFGELIGAFLLQAYDRMGAPDKFSLVELGPGRGTLMADILRTLSLRPNMLEAAQLTLVETSDKLRQVQRNTLASAPLKPSFADSIDDLPPMPTLLVANEFFDALPIHQFVRTDSGWQQRIVGLNEAGDDLSFGIGPAILSSLDVPDHLMLSGPGSVLETQPAGNAIAERLAHLIAKEGGTALIIDYGYLKSATGDTLQAIHRHAYQDALANPGEADLTAHVNFDALAKAARAGGAIPFPPLEQGEFLLRLGLLQRAGALGRDKSHAAQEQIRDDVERLAAPQQMGSLFKVLAFSQTPAPLEPFDHPNEGPTA